MPFIGIKLIDILLAAMHLVQESAMTSISKVRKLAEVILPPSIPIAIIVAAAWLPLPPLARQILMAILLVWLYLVVLTDWVLPDPGAERGQDMKTSLNLDPYRKSFLALAAVAATTFVLALIGRDKVGEAVIALLYLVPVGWSASRWGHAAGIAAAVAAALCFDFFFIPPFYTFVVGNLEGWLVLVIFLTVAIVVIDRIEASLSRARTSEHEAIMMYELSSILGGLRTQDAVAHAVARFFQERYLAPLVTVAVQPRAEAAEIAVYEPQDGIMKGKPDSVLPILSPWGLIGEVQIWHGDVELPAMESRLFRNFVAQIEQALERSRMAEAEGRLTTIDRAPKKKK